MSNDKVINTRVSKKLYEKFLVKRRKQNYGLKFDPQFS